MTDTIQEVDVAVVGAGVAGCYTAWRLRTLVKQQLAAKSPLLPLLKNKDRLDVALFEYSDRVGGRLWSAAVKDMPDQFVEFGGMRFYKEMHIVWNLIEKLGLDRYAIPFPVGMPENFVYVRAQHVRRSEVTQPNALPYRLHYLEQGKTTGALADYVCDVAIQGFIKLRNAYAAAFEAGDWDKVELLRKDYEARKQTSKLGNRTVYEMSWWELQTKVLSSEAFKLVLQTSGYDVANTNGNAAHSIDEIFYSPTKGGFWRLSHGFEDVPDKLQQEFQDQGGLTFLLHRLLRFDKVDPHTEGGPYDLVFHQRRSAKDPVYDSDEAALARSGEKCSKVRAKMIVLAMPVRALSLLDQDNFFFRPPPRLRVDRRAKFQTAMNAVLRVDAFKLFVAYRHPWWEQTGVSKGQSVTDLPVRQCYYWAATDRGNSILMATYNNGVAVPYWQALQSGPPFPPDDSALAAGDPFHGRAFAQVNRVGLRLAGNPASAVASAAMLTQLPRTATQAMVEQAHAQLTEMHDVKHAPMPYDAHFQDWSVDPFGAGWHQWKSGTNEDGTIPYMQQPMEEEPVFIVGECWSNAQGWVQGALNTSEAMLQDMLGLPWPDWLSKGGTWLGPRTRLLS